MTLVRHSWAGLAAVMVASLAQLPASAEPQVLPQAARQGMCTSADAKAVTVVIDYQSLGAGVAKYCVTGLAKGATGLTALRSVASVQGTTSSGLAVVCRINSRPGASQSLKLPNGKTYTETCVNTPPAAAYWSYWHASQGGSWQYSSQGAATSQVSFGGYEGWSFALGAGFGQAPKPRVTPVKWAVAVTSKPTAAKATSTKATAAKPTTAKATSAKATSATSGKATSKQTGQPASSAAPTSTRLAGEPTTTDAEATAEGTAQEVSPSGDSPSAAPSEVWPLDPDDPFGSSPGTTVSVLAACAALLAGVGGFAWWRRRRVP